MGALAALACMVLIVVIITDMYRFRGGAKMWVPQGSAKPKPRSKESIAFHSLYSCPLGLSLQKFPRSGKKFFFGICRIFWAIGLRCADIMV